MITLITGTPGAGKTAWTVQELTRLPSQRKVYIHGIPELKLAHEPIYCTSELCDLCAGVVHYVESEPVYNEQGELIQQGYEQFELVEKHGEPVLLVEEWPEWATDGSLIVIDEVQRIWRPSNTGKLPDDISRLETHRHRGLDFWLISQGPHLFHSNIRLLIGRHIHLVAKWNGRSEYEWPECRQNVTSRGDAVTRPYTLPKKVFGLYKSASLHVKQTHRKPLAFYGLFACITALLILGYLSYKRVSSHMEPAAVAQTSAQPAQAGGAGGGVAAAIVPGQARAKAGFPDFTPTVPGVPESAPAYSELVKVVAAPILSGCVQTKKDCKCYTQQATPYPTTQQYCQEVIKNHRFNPYHSSSLSVTVQNKDVQPSKSDRDNSPT
jgi:zona occludens toxin